MQTGPDAVDPVITAAEIEFWTAQRESSKADAAWLDRHRIRDQARLATMQGMRALLESLRDGSSELEDFRATFDRKTRGEWDTFGLKGQSGAMVLNKLCKHVHDHERLRAELLAVLATPTDEAGARERMATFADYLGGLVDAGLVRSVDVQRKRVPMFVSAWWHVHAPEQWPVFYPASRKALEARRLVARTDDRIDDYFRFRRTWLTLARRLGGTAWELEHLAARMSSNELATTPPPSEPPPSKPTQRVWLFAPGPGAKHWPDFVREEIMAYGAEPLGPLDQYPDLEAFKAAWKAERGADGADPVHEALACRDFAYTVQPGDLVFVKKGRSHLIGWGIVKSGYRYEPNRPGYKNVRDVEWTTIDPVPAHTTLISKRLTNITRYTNFVERLKQTVGMPPNPSLDEEPDPIFPGYDLEQAMQELFLQEAEVTEILERLQEKRNIILQGPPGVGKTFLARRLAYLLLGAKDRDRVQVVQFHQSYGYEDFVQGYRPSGTGFVRRNGPFLEFCGAAAQDPERPHVLIIDEINRANLSKVFGELLMLIEADKRDPEHAITLAYATEDDDRFFVPDNLYIIGTMNTADRSLAVVDYALRRRFAFIEVSPGFETPAFAEHLRTKLGVSADLLEQIRTRLRRLNDTIRADLRNLGPGYEIGHSYFCQAPANGSADASWYERIIETEIEPLLREYWFDDEDLATSACEALRLD